MQKNTNEEQRNQPKNFIKYSGMAFQMLATIGLSAWAGIKLDEYYKVKNHWFTISLLLLGVVGSIYFVVRSLLKNE